MFKHCINLLKAENEQVSYCLKLKSGIERCPSQCGYYSSGVPGSVEETRRNQFNFECLHFVRVQDEHETPEYVCRLMHLQNPPCNECRFPEYAEASILNI